MKLILKGGIILTPVLTYVGILVMLLGICGLLGIEITSTIPFIAFVLNSPILVGTMVLSFYKRGEDD